MPKPSKPGSGKDRGSLTQKADSQEVRISQVSNVSKAVSAMGKETTRRMKETDRKIAEGGDSQEIAGSMNSVLNSLKSTVDSLNRGVEAATLGTAKAAQEAISQYGQAISEDFKINRQNMVASALSTSTPIFGYFASKFMETGIFKKTKEKMSDSISNIFKKKSKGGSLPDDMDEDGGGGKQLTPAQAAEKARMNRANQKQDSVSAMKVANQEKYEKYDKPTEQKMLVALTAIQGAVGATIGKFSQWYDKFLIEHPYYRRMTMAFKYLSAGASGLWKAVYFVWRPRGGYKKHLSKAKNPFQAINQNLGALFVQTMPRLDAIMIYTKATAIAMRDLSSHVTGKRYPMMDPSKLGGTWSIGGVAMAIMRGAGRIAMKGARKLRDSMYEKGSKGHDLFSGAIEGTEKLGKIADYGLTGPGRMKDWVKGKTLDQLPGAKEKRRMFGGLEGTGGGIGGGFGKQEPIPVKISSESEGVFNVKKLKQMRLPKNFKGMGKRHKPTFFTQGVFDEYFAKNAIKQDKQNKKLIGYTSSTTKELKEHNKREKRRSIMGIIGGLFSGAKNLLSGALSFILPFLGLGGLGGGGGLKKWISGLFLKGGAIRAGVAALFAKGGPIATALASKAFWGPIGAAFAGWGIGTWINENWIKPWMNEWMDKQNDKQQKGIKDVDKIRESLAKDARKGDYESRVGLHAATGIKHQKTLLGGAINAAAVRAGQMKVIKKNKAAYAKYDLDEITKARTRWQHSLPYYAWYARMSQGKDPEKFGIEKEEAFLKYLQKVGTPMSKEELGSTSKDYHAAQVAAGGGTMTDKAKKLAIVTATEAERLARQYGGAAKDYINKNYPEAVAYGKRLKEKLSNAADAIKTKASVTADEIQSLVAKYGGHARDYANKTYPEALAHGKKLQEKAIQAKDYIKDKAIQGTEVTVAKAKELSDKYGGKPEEYLNMTLAQAKKYGEQISKYAGDINLKEKYDEAKKYGKDAKDYVKDIDVKETYDKSKSWFARQFDSLKNWLTGGSNEALKKTGEYIDLGKGNFVELYRQGKGNIKEMWETASPEKKAWIRQNAERLLASGQITAEELKKMGIQIKDATLEGAEKVGNAVVSSAVHTTNNISNAVSNMTQGGGGGNSQRMMDESAMNDIASGHLQY
jgi:hypothetical protein